MAERPVFAADENWYVRTRMTEFTFCSGFAKVQKQRCIDNLHLSYSSRFPEAKLLEISSFSKNELGVALSAFHLTLPLKDGQQVPVEAAYQAGKIFRDGGPFTDLLFASPSAAKKDSRLLSHGPVTGFVFEGTSFPVQPVNLFYTWLYLQGLSSHPELADALMEYDSFTDVVFNPNKSVNCQALSAACYVSLRKKKELDLALSDPEFLKNVLKKIR